MTNCERVLFTVPKKMLQDVIDLYSVEEGECFFEYESSEKDGKILGVFFGKEEEIESGPYTGTKGDYVMTIFEEEQVKKIEEFKLLKNQKIGGE